MFHTAQDHIDDLEQDSINSIADALELLQSCTKPWTYAEHGSDFVL